jgi:hypothetical protein
VAVEALALGACLYDPLHKYIDNPSYTKPSSCGATKLRDILEEVRQDKRFDGLYDHRSGDISKVFEEQEEAFLQYWNAWDLSDPTSQFQESQATAVAILMGTSAPKDTTFDFFFVHILTSSHAVRILLSLLPAKHHMNLVRQWWLFTLAVYIAQLRPRIDTGAVEEYELNGQTWKTVVHKALDSPNATDAHYVKGMSHITKTNKRVTGLHYTALRAMKSISETWGDDSQFYEKAAVLFANEFEHWAGF